MAKPRRFEKIKTMSSIDSDEFKDIVVVQSLPAQYDRNSRALGGHHDVVRSSSIDLERLEMVEDVERLENGGNAVNVQNDDEDEPPTPISTVHETIDRYFVSEDEHRSSLKWPLQSHHRPHVSLRNVAIQRMAASTAKRAKHQKQQNERNLSMDSPEIHNVRSQEMDSVADSPEMLSTDDPRHPPIRQMTPGQNEDEFEEEHFGDFQPKEERLKMVNAHSLEPSAGTVSVSGSERRIDVEHPMDVPNVQTTLHREAKSGDDVILDLFTAEIEDNEVIKVDKERSQRTEEQPDPLEEVVLEMAASGDDVILDLFGAENRDKVDGLLSPEDELDLDGDGDEVGDDVHSVVIKGKVEENETNEMMMDSEQITAEMKAESLSFSPNPLSADPDTDPLLSVMDDVDADVEHRDSVKSPFPTVSPLGSIMAGNVSGNVIVSAPAEPEIVVDHRSELELLVDSPLNSMLSLNEAAGSPDPSSLNEPDRGVTGVESVDAQNAMDSASPLDAVMEQSVESSAGSVIHEVIHKVDGDGDGGALEQKNGMESPESGPKTVDVDEWMQSENGKAVQNEIENQNENENESMASEIIYDSPKISEAMAVEEALDPQIFGNAKHEESDSEEESESAYSNGTDPNVY